MGVLDNSQYSEFDPEAALAAVTDKTNKQMARDELKTRQQNTVNAGKMKNQLGKLESENELKNQRKELLKAVGGKMGLDKKQMGKVHRNQMLTSLSKLAFLTVLVGCELDMVGFGMAFMSYWQLEMVFVKVMLIIGPTGYATALLMYKLFSERCFDTPPDTSQSHDAAFQLPGAISARTNTSTSTTVVAKEPVRVCLYHAVPVLRMYLVVKDLDKNDVECLFRANSLSSFTLGTAQVVGMLFALIQGSQFDLFMKINVGSFCINWVITLMYFTTSVPGRIKSSVENDAMKYNSTSHLTTEMARHKKLCTDCARNPSDRQLAKNLEAWQATQTREIEMLTGVNIDEELKAANGDDGHGDDFMKFNDLELMELRRFAHVVYNDQYRQVAVGC